MLIFALSPVAILAMVILIQLESSGIGWAKLREIFEIPFYLALAGLVLGRVGWFYKRLLQTNDDSHQLAKLFDWLVSNLVISSASSAVLVLIYFFVEPRPLSALGEVSTSPHSFIRLWLFVAILFFAASSVFALAQKANKKLQ
jgi:hypothetical protein